MAKINNKGQALVEFLIVVPIFILFIFFLKDSFNILPKKLSVQEATRFALWEKAKGINDSKVNNEISRIIKDSNYTGIDKITNSTIKNFKMDPLSQGIVKLAGLNKNGKISCSISLPISSHIFTRFKINYRLSSTQTILSNSWFSSSDKEMKERVSKIYLGGKIGWIGKGTPLELLNIYKPRINPDSLPVINNEKR